MALNRLELWALQHMISGAFWAGPCKGPYLRNPQDDSRHKHRLNKIVCNPLYTAYFTTEKKDRVTVLDVLRNFRERTFRLNAEAFRFLDIFGLSGRVVRELKQWPQEKDLREEEFLSLSEKNLK